MSVMKWQAEFKEGPSFLLPGVRGPVISSPGVGGSCDYEGMATPVITDYHIRGYLAETAVSTQGLSCRL